ncbi:MAG: histidine phosphatase family protein, partial [Rubrobacter sp.]|nr:histidine phosphatase family protein [Rubrobacter sp.]
MIYLRHAATEAGGVNGTETLGDRDAQRNLSGEGREQSEAIGEAFEEIDVPVGEVLSSPYFRNTDTAELAFGRAQPTEDLLELLSVEGEDEERNRRFSRRGRRRHAGGGRGRGLRAARERRFRAARAAHARGVERPAVIPAGAAAPRKYTEGAQAWSRETANPAAGRACTGARSETTWSARRWRRLSAPLCWSLPAPPSRRPPC